MQFELTDGQLNAVLDLIRLGAQQLKFQQKNGEEAVKFFTEQVFVKKDNKEKPTNAVPTK